MREKLPDTRHSITKTLRVIGEKPIYVTAGFYPDGRLGEVFVYYEGGDQVGALCDAMAMAISLGLQYGVEPEVYTSKLRGFQIEPRGFTGDPGYPVVSSYLDYFGRWIDNLVAVNGQKTEAPAG